MNWVFTPLVKITFVSDPSKANFRFVVAAGGGGEGQSFTLNRVGQVHEGDNTYTFSHDFGHCLGLQHPGYGNTVSHTVRMLMGMEASEYSAAPDLLMGGGNSMSDTYYQIWADALYHQYSATTNSDYLNLNWSVIQDKSAKQ